MTDQTAYQKAVAIRCRDLVAAHLDVVEKTHPLTDGLRAVLDSHFAALLYELYCGASTFQPNKMQLAAARADHQSLA